MTSPLLPISIPGPGFMGLNKQASSVDLEPGWCLDALNCVRDRTGRLASRKGWTAVTNTPIGGTPDVEGLWEYKKIDGTTQFISAASTTLYSGSTVLTPLTVSAGVATITGANWQAVNFNNYLWLFQSACTPLRWDGTNLVTVASLGGTGTVPQGNCVLSAYGRLWVADTSTEKTVLYYSDLLIGQNWTGGSAGSLDLKSVWTKGQDQIVSLAAFNGFLIIFGKKSIVVYQNPSNPATMSLVENIQGLGCISRDSVADIGTDLLFLSDTGVRSLARTIQTTTMPMQDISKNIRDDLVYSIANETNLGKVRAVYHEPEKFYLLNFPGQNISYCFDISLLTSDQSAPVTTWNGMNPKALCSSIDRSLYIGKAGVVGKYTGSTDNGSTYDMSYKSPWMSWGQPSVTKILKKILYTVSGSNNTTFTIKWGYDYNGTNYSSQQTISGSGASEWGIGEYGIAEYTEGIQIAQLSTPGSSAGKMVQVGLTSTINGTQLAIQKIDVYAKQGRMI